MKKISAIIRSSKFEEVREALADIGVNFFTFMEVKGFGHQKGEEVFYRGSVYDVGYIARMEIQIVTEEEVVDQIIEAILSSAYTGEIGDGKIFVTDVDRSISIRTRAEGTAAFN